VIFRRNTMLVLAVLALAGSACSSADTLATVNGDTISMAELDELNPSYVDVPTAPGEQMRNDVTQLIISAAIASAAEEQFGVVFTDADIAARISNPPDRYAALFAAAPGPDQVRSDALQTLVRDTVVPRLIEEQYGTIDAYIAEQPQDVVQVCVRHIMLATAAEAEVVAERLAAGEAFEDVRVEVSLDTSSPEGLLTVNGQCPVHVGALGEEFAQAVAEAPLGQPTGPVASNAGFFHIIQVEDRVSPSSGVAGKEQFLDLLDAAAASALFNPWASAAIRDADVEVASFIGRWSPDGLGIAPPGDVLPSG
jgi:parvulin-like peptidyl-prolyl isomerase